MTTRQSGQLAGRTRSRAFSLVEVLAVVLILGIIASMAIAQFSGSKGVAQANGTRGALASVRAAIASFSERAIIAGNDQFPTLAELNTIGTVVDRRIKANPFTKVSGVRGANLAEADARSVVSPTTFGWNYFVDNASSPPRAVFWANSDETTTVSDGGGGFLTANQM